MTTPAGAGGTETVTGPELRRRLRRSLRWQKLRALLLIAPLLIFVLISFVMPIADMLFRSVENGIVSDILPRTAASVKNWDPDQDSLPDENVYRSLFVDLTIAVKQRRHTRIGSRLNYESAGVSSSFRRVGRGIRRFETEPYVRHFTGRDPDWADGAHLERLFSDADIAAALPGSASAFQAWQQHFAESPGEAPGDFVYVALAAELDALTPDNLRGLSSGLLDEAHAGIDELSSASIKEAFTEFDDAWAETDLWQTIQTFSPRFTDGYFLNSLDLKKGFDGIEQRDPSERLYLVIFGRTAVMSMTITVLCILLGYPVAYFLAHLPLRKANLFLILVLLPFWTSLLVRTSAWKVLLQQEGVINDILVAIGLVEDSARLVMINNQFGTIVAMTHILLPFMILPLYSVMKTIPPSYVRAAMSLGANPVTAFRRVYFPQSLPGIGAGSVLVFILAIGYYITPELVGGIKGTFISNRIAYHISSSLNWGLAAALGTILLAAVLILYWLYDRIVGIDNVKLG